MTGKMFRFVGFLLIIQLCQAQPNTLTGGSTGDNGHKFVDGTANTAKILLGLHCVQDEDSSQEVRFKFYVNQGDKGFKFESSATTLRANELIMYEACYFIDAAAYASASKTLTKATAHENCGDSVDFTTLDASAADTTYQRRTKTASLKIPDPSQANDYKCGSRRNGNTIEVAVYCKRDKDFDKAFDVVFTATYSTNGCTAEMLTPDGVNILDPPKVNIKHNLETTMKAYTVNGVVSGQESPVGNLITGPIDLQTAIYLEICIRIPEVDTGSNINNQFFEDGVSPIGLRIHTCTAKPDPSQDFQSSFQPITTVDDNGCGTAEAGDNGHNEFFQENQYIWEFLEDSSIDKDHLMSPNCFRTVSFEATSFARAKAAEIVKTIFTCKLEPSTSGTDRNVFGNKAGGTQDYPTCPIAKRRKRETITVGEDIPEELSVTVDVRIPGANATSSGDFDGCFEKKTFIGLTSAMMTLLLAVIIAAIYLGVKLSTAEQEASIDSMTGIQNKGYY